MNPLAFAALVTDPSVDVSADNVRRWTRDGLPLPPNELEVLLSARPQDWREAVDWLDAEIAAFLDRQSEIIFRSGYLAGRHDEREGL